MTTLLSKAEAPETQGLHIGFDKLLTILVHLWQKYVLPSYTGRIRVYELRGLRKIHNEETDLNTLCHK